MASWGRLGGALGAKPQQERGDWIFGTDFGLSFGGLGSSWALLRVSWRVFLPLLERLGRVLTTSWKNTRFLKSQKRFF